MKKTSKSDSVPGTRKTAGSIVPPPDDALFGRVASILEQARTNVVRAVNHNMVVAYWLIGREIVMELQRGQERAGYGQTIVAALSAQLTAAYGCGYSQANLWNFKQFYLAYEQKILYTPCRELMAGFNERLSWSHYRTLMRVGNEAARDYYEQEAASADWSVRALERQIQTHAYERLVTTQARKKKQSAICENTPAGAEDKPLEKSLAAKLDALPHNPLDSLKDPYVLEFLNIPDPAALHESSLEAAIIAHLRDFLLEIGKGFAFVARQKRLSFDDEHLYVDLVFYSIPLRCYLLIDLKTGKLAHADVGQMDGYVRMFDDLMCGPEENPTIGLILCTEHNSAVARYSVLNDRRQIFASRYVTCLPTEAELAAEIQRTRARIEGRGGQKDSLPGGKRIKKR